MLATLVIVCREVIEAGLIIGIVLAATRGVSLRGLWVGYGVAGGIAGACLVAAFAGSIAGLFQGSGQELFNASILLLAVVMLTWHNVWMASHGREMAEDMRAIGTAVAQGTRSLAALAIVVGIAVLREGAEVVLFLYGIAASGGASSLSMLIGGIVGIACGAAVTAFLYFGLLAIPTRKLFAVTSGLITLLAAGLAAQAILYIQQAGHLRFLTARLWDSSWLLDDRSIVGQLVHTLIGYTARPSGAQLLVYLATIVVIVTLMQVTGRSNAVRASSAATAGD
ncbi:MAG: FTR1 family protein [Parvibaculum sp.]|uniref:FTR1 family iron permease n=1 Tax=Parvibaculum sp. TaxID=2024848 RepID=UPI003C7849E0